MSIVTFLSNNECYSFNGFEQFKNDKHHIYTSAYIKNQLHEKKIDEFFLTNIEAPHKHFSVLALLGSLAGVIAPTIYFGKKKYPKLELDSLKNIYKAIDIDYGLKEILTVGYGGLAGGLVGGLIDKKEPKKLDKIQEAVYQSMNVAFPAVLVAGAMKMCEKIPNLNNSVSKFSASAIGMFIGINLAVKLANKVDNKIFDKYNIEPDRKFKKKDIVVHVDDLVGALVLAKIPFAEKFHVNKIIPLIYSWCGFHVGEK